LLFGLPSNNLITETTPSSPIMRRGDERRGEERRGEERRGEERRGEERR
jgi:hypothetical protein